MRIIDAAPHGDLRGVFCEVYRRDVMERAGLPAEWAQENHSISAAAGTVRGLHFQIAPFAQAKLVRVVRGRAFDVAVDLRRSSRTFGRHVAVELAAGDWRQLYLPAGFAHGFCTLEPGTEVLYKTSAPYAPAHERGLAWDDPRLAIPWPVAPAEAVLSAKDRGWPPLAALDACLD